MRATWLLRERHVLGEGKFAEIVIWRIPSPARGSPYAFKYRLAFVVDEVCVLRFDNETSKGNHKHVGDSESPYDFIGTERLTEEFWSGVDAWRSA